MEEEIKIKLMLHSNPVVISLACATHCDYNKANTEVYMGPCEPNSKAQHKFIMVSRIRNCSLDLEHHQNLISNSNIGIV